MEIKPIQTRLFLENENLETFILEHIGILDERSIVVVSSKIVSLSEGRTMEVGTERVKEDLVRAEASWVMRKKYVWLTIKNGMYMASAGIDESNGNGKCVLLPKDSFATADSLREKLLNQFHLSTLGVIVVDSCPLPLRRGVIGFALGYAGFRGVKDYREKKDLFGRKFVFSSVNMSDSLATSAMMLMGEGDERQPLAIVKDAPVEFCDRVDANEIHIGLEEDMFGPLFRDNRNRE